MVSENRALKGIFGPKRKKEQDGKHFIIYSSWNFIRMNKSSRIRSFKVGRTYERI
jgi:hypothetical protein